MHHWDVGLCEPAQKPYHPSHFQNYALHMHKLIASHNGFLYDICRNDYRLINSVGAPVVVNSVPRRSGAPTEGRPYKSAKIRGAHGGPTSPRRSGAPTEGRPYKSTRS